MKQQIILNIGVSGSGKTTWTTEQMENNSRILRINRDDIRKVLVGDLGGYYQRPDLNTLEIMVNNIEASMAVDMLRRGYDIIFDNTHLKPSYIKEKIDLMNHWAEALNREIEFKFKVFSEESSGLLKNRILNRDGNIFDDIKELSYIDKQISQLPSIAKYIKENYPNQIL
jgi:predicted kinase